MNNNESSKKQRTYVAIDLKSFYASAECVARGLDPLTTNLVVADTSRTEKTICLAVSPTLKACHIPGRARLFEVIQRVREINRARLARIPDHKFKGKSALATELREHKDWEVDYIAATPRMAEYIRVSSNIYQIYLKYIAPEDIHVYSIDEVFMDVTDYLGTYRKTAHELAMEMIHDILKETGITATAGIGTNMYLAKVAMDIVAKHVKADKDGVRIAELDERSYREKLWSHEPLTDFWRIGHGVAERLHMFGMKTMGDVARFSLKYQDVLYQQFGVNAELIIDHAWGWEPCEMKHIKSYKPQANSLGQGQVLTDAYSFDKALVVMKEMAEALSLDLVSKRLVTRQVVINIGYDRTSLDNPNTMSQYHGSVSQDWYGRKVPKGVHATVNLDRLTSSTRLITAGVEDAFKQVVNPILLVRRMNITACKVVDENEAKKEEVKPMQLDLFADNDTIMREKEAEKAALTRERKMQEATLRIKGMFGKNAILKGLDFEEGATARERNQQIGGHKA